MDYMSLWGLFTSALISSTLAPGGSEAVFVYLVSEQQINPVLLWLTATTGNTLGALITWFMGFVAAKRFPLDNSLAHKNRHAFDALREWGALALLFSWLPLIGDGLCLLAGWLRLPFFKSFLFIVLGKALRYAIILSFFVFM